MANVTQLLQAMAAGNRQAAQELLPLVYDELRNLARRKLSQEAPGQTLQPTALVHEAYLRLVGPPASEEISSVDGHEPRSVGQAANKWDGRGHFFAAAAEAMRRILVENARARRRLKRGGEMQRVLLDEVAVAAPEPDDRLLDLDAALEKLQQQDPRKADLVKLRYFAGLTIEQAAEVLGIGTSTADRDWAYARSWLFREMSQAGAAE